MRGHSPPVTALCAWPVTVCRHACMAGRHGHACRGVPCGMDGDAGPRDQPRRCDVRDGQRAKPLKGAGGEGRDEAHGEHPPPNLDAIVTCSGLAGSRRHRGRRRGRGRGRVAGRRGRRGGHHPGRLDRVHGLFAKTDGHPQLRHCRAFWDAVPEIGVVLPGEHHHRAGRHVPPCHDERRGDAVLCVARPRLEDERPDGANCEVVDRRVVSTHFPDASFAVASVVNLLSW